MLLLRIIFDLMKKLFCFLCVAFFIKSYGQDNPCDRKGVPYSSLPQDTTITLPSGTSFTFNRCEFFDLRDCIEIFEIIDTAGLNARNLTMYDSRGNALLTCGMVSLQLKNCDKTCFEVPVKVRVRIRFQDCSGTINGVPNLYTSNGGRWQQVEKGKAKIVTENNIRYFEFFTNCGVSINCDVPKKGRKVKFIAPKGNKIEQLRVGTNCPLFFYDELLSNPKRRTKVRLFCILPENTTAQAKLSAASSEIILTPQRKLSDLRHGNKRLQCKKEPLSFFQGLFSWLKRGKGNFHKKYYL